MTENLENDNLEEEQLPQPAELKVNLDPGAIKNVLRDYKKIKKYMKSSIYAIKKMDGKETKITKLIKDIDNM